MRTYVRVARGNDPPRRPRRLLRVGGAARRPTAARAAGDRRGRRRARGELRGEGVRDQDGDGRPPRAPAVPARRGRPASHVGLLRGEQGRVRGVRGHDAARRRALDRRGLPGRSRARAPRGLADGHRRTPAPQGALRGRAPDHRRDRTDEVPRQGGERRGEAERAPARPARRRARLSPSAAGRAAVGCGPRHGREAPRARAQDRRPGRRARRARCSSVSRPRLGSAPARARAQPRSAASADGSAPALHRVTAGARAAADVARGDRLVSHRHRRPDRPAAARWPSGLSHRRSAAAVRRFHAGDAVADDAAIDRSVGGDPRGGPHPLHRLDPADRAPGDHARRASR